MRNTILFKAALLFFIFLQHQPGSAQSRTNCDTIYLTSGERIPATVYNYQKDTVFYYTCVPGPISEKWAIAKSIEKVRQTNGSFISCTVTPADSSYFSLIRLFDKTTYRGIIIASTNDDITFVNMEREIMQLKRSRIVSITKVKKGELPGRIQERDALSTHYLLGSNNLRLRQGEHYYQNGLIMYNFARFGLTDNFSAGAGVIPLIILGENSFVIWASPKFQFPIKNTKLSLGGGGSFFTLRGEGDTENAGFMYGSGTIGSKRSNITFSMGPGYFNGDFSAKPLFSIAAMQYVGPKVSLLVEAYSSTASDDRSSIIMGGMRLHLKKITTDIGLLCLTDNDGLFFALPWLSCTFPFGKK